MAHVRKDRVKELTTTTGTGALTLAGAVIGFQAFAAAIGVGNTCEYVIVGPNGAWETGLGTLSAASTLQRTTVYESSNAGAAVSLPVGSKEVFVTLPASRVPGDPPAKASTAEVLAATDDAKFITPAADNAAGATYAVPFSSSITLDGANGRVQRITATGNFTLALPINFKNGRYELEVVSSGAARTMSFASGWRFAKGKLATLTQAAGAIDVFLIRPSGANPAIVPTAFVDLKAPV